jgi:hypothetical protein
MSDQSARRDGPRFDYAQGKPRLSGRAKLVFLTSQVTGAAALLASALREIFDEAAYTRFLSRHGLSVSRDSYAAFLREQELIKSRPHRCC